MKKIESIFAYSAVCLTIFSCSTPKLTIQGDSAGDVEYIDLNQPESPGKFLGQVPITMEQSDIEEGKGFRISANTKIPQIIIPIPLNAPNITMTVKLSEDPSSKLASVRMRGSNDPENPNFSYRLIVKAYEAMLKGKYEAARDLAKQFANVRPNIAMPYIITALAFIKEGKKSEAKTALSVAKTLDPSDTEIQQLLKNVETSSTTKATTEIKP